VCILLIIYSLIVVEFEISLELRWPLNMPPLFFSAFICSILSLPQSLWSFRKFIGAPVFASSFTNIDFYRSASGGGMKINLFASGFKSIVFIFAYSNSETLSYKEQF